MTTTNDATTVAPRSHGVVALVHPLVEPRTYQQTVHLLADLPMGILWFTLVVTG